MWGVSELVRLSGAWWLGGDKLRILWNGHCYHPDMVVGLIVNCATMLVCQFAISDMAPAVCRSGHVACILMFQFQSAPADA